MSDKGKHYASGDRVVSGGGWSSKRAGTVTRAGRGVSVMVRWDGDTDDEPAYLDAIRPETSEDVSKRKHATRMNAWEGSEPAHAIVITERDRSWYSTHKVTGFAVHATTPDEMRIAARELEALADWFAARPR